VASRILSEVCSKQVLCKCRPLLFLARESANGHQSRPVGHNTCLYCPHIECPSDVQTSPPNPGFPVRPHGSLFLMSLSRLMPPTSFVGLSLTSADAYNPSLSLLPLPIQPDLPDFSHTTAQLRAHSSLPPPFPIPATFPPLHQLHNETIGLAAKTALLNTRD
jgi:hypothetical protein